MRLIFYLLLVIFLYSCREATSRLEQTLQLAGDNKLELQKVLDHYASDSLKLKAAIFLIENMPGHYSLDGPYLRQLQRIIDSTGTPYLMKKVILMQPLRYPYSRQQLRAEPDLEQVKADYLIHQIDQTFRLWTNSPWLEDLTLESFLEYLLPYRIGNEPLDYWRDSIDSRLRERLQEAGRYFDNQKHSPYNMAQIVYGHALGLDSGKDNLAGIPFSAKECVFSSQLQLLAYRMVGIPAAIDHVPYWADMNGFHEWTVVMDTQNKDILAGQIEMKNAPKVYRRTYSTNPIPVPEKDEYIPPFFTNPFNRDVTDKYLHTSDVTVSATVPVQARHAYLAIFNGGNSGSSTGATCNKTKPAFTPWVPTSCISPSISRRNTSETSPIPSSCGQTGQLSHYVPTRHDDRLSPSPVNILYITTKCTTATPLLGQGFKHRTIQHSETP